MCVNLLSPYGYGDYWYTVNDYVTQLIGMAVKTNVLQLFNFYLTHIN